MFSTGSELPTHALRQETHSDSQALLLPPYEVSLTIKCILYLQLTLRLHQWMHFYVHLRVRIMSYKWSFDVLSILIITFCTRL